MASSAAHADDEELSLSALLTRGLGGAEFVLAAPSPNDTAVQTRLQQSLSDLLLCASLIERLGVFSPNETADDIQTGSLRCVLVNAFLGLLLGLAKTKGSQERAENLELAKTRYESYLKLVDTYALIPSSSRDALAGPSTSTQDPTRRREAKIAQFKAEKALKASLEELRLRRRRARVVSTTTGVSLGGDAAQPESTSAFDFGGDEEGEEEDDELVRPLYLALIATYYLTSSSELSSIDMELELLAHSMKMSELPSSRPEGARERLRSTEGEEGSSATWRLDANRQAAANGPLLDSRGKVLRPFTILPSASGATATAGPMDTRLRFASEVFRPSHRLPTMSIDEFLDEEQRRGNILQGGGPRTTQEGEDEDEEKRAEEEDDTVAGWEREEAGLREKREWDDYRDSHRKGEGNMYNRG